MVNIKVVAKEAGVSASTVSRVLSGNAPVNDDTRVKVLAAIEKLNYQPNAFAQGLKGGRIQTIGLVIPNVRNLVFPAAIRGIEDKAKEHGYNVVLCNTDEDIEKERFYIENLRRRLIDGFIFSTARPGHEYLLDLPREGVPVVFMIRELGESVDTVVLDNKEGAYQATRFLISRGLRNLALINGRTDLPLYRDRFEGFVRASQEAELPVDQSLIVHGANGWDEGYQVMRMILEKGKLPDAIFATSDPKAIGVIRALREKGLKVPGDISVMGFDNLDFASLVDPPLTTVAQPFYEMGVQACARLIELIEAGSDGEARKDVFPAELMIRNSVV